MTSFTRKLHEIAPAAAQEIRRQSYRDYRYGKNVTLAMFTPEAHNLPFRTTSSSTAQPRYGFGAGLAALHSASPSGSVTAFGKREVAPSLPAYECWAPELGKPRQIVWAADSFAARTQYAAHHQITVSDVTARRK